MVAVFAHIRHGLVRGMQWDVDRLPASVRGPVPWSAAGAVEPGYEETKILAVSCVPGPLGRT